MAKLTIKEIKPNIFHIVAKNQYDLNSTFVRLSEFYESSSNRFRGKVFTLEDYMDWYAKKFENFTYTTNWTGFNIPGDTVRRFFSEFHSIALKKEKKLESLLRNCMGRSRYYNQDKKFYLIGTWDVGDLAHELAHAFYYLDDDYRKAQNGLYNPKGLMFKKLKKALISTGYSKLDKILLDEVQAYLGEPNGLRRPWMKEFNIEWKMEIVRKYRRNLKEKLR